MVQTNVGMHWAREHFDGRAVWRVHSKCIKCKNKWHLLQVSARLRERDASQSDSVATASADDDDENLDDSDGTDS